MILVDTSVWIDFLRSGNSLLENLLREGEVATHPIVIGELHVGNISKRGEFLGLLKNLPLTTEASHAEVIEFIEANRLYGKGVGYMDVSILCSSILSGTPLWTMDKKLEKLAKKFGPK
jgi:predicted nucleic acid-binding protein